MLSPEEESIINLVCTLNKNNIELAKMLIKSLQPVITEAELLEKCGFYEVNMKSFDDFDTQRYYDNSSGLRISDISHVKDYDKIDGGNLRCLKYLRNSNIISLSLKSYDFKSLEGIENLSESLLNFSLLGTNTITDLSPLEKCKKISHLYLKNINIDIVPSLYAFPNLKNLEYRYCKFSKEDLEEFENYNFNCKVKHHV